MGTVFSAAGVLGEHDVVRHGPLRFWAERGLIHCEDERDSSYLCYSIRTALQRMSALSDMLGNTNDRAMHSEDQFDQNNRARIQHMLEGLSTMVTRCKIQGMPDDPSARRDLKRRAPKSVVVPQLYGGGL